MVNLERHVSNVRNHYGLPCIIAINHRTTDTDAEVALLKDRMAKHGAPVVLARHWAEGGAGAVDLAHAVVVIDFRLLHAGFGGLHISVGEESVPNGPGAGDAKKPTIDHVGETAGQHVALVGLNGLGIDLREVSGEFFIHSRGFAEDI